MSVYNQKQRWKLTLLLSAVLLSIISTVFLLQLIDRVEKEERKGVLLWAEAIQRKSVLVEYTKELFDKLKTDERDKVELWSEAMHRLLMADNTNDLTLMVKIISSNKNIPIILTNDKDEVVSSINLDCPIEQGKHIPDSLKKQFTKHKPIQIIYGNKLLNKLYYKDSKLFAELQVVLNSIVESFINEIVSNSASVPVIVTDSSKTQVLAYGNIDQSEAKDHLKLSLRLHEMAQSNAPIEFKLSRFQTNYIFYEDSYFLKILKYYPIALFVALVAFLLIAYFALTSSRRYEQNQVWVGMSKETAHQLGTPISSLMAWVDILKIKDIDDDTIAEISKDIFRLQVIADRFSKIGSANVNKEEDIVELIENTLDYIRKRTPPKISLDFTCNVVFLPVPLNRTLMEWVIENLCKNAIDSIGGAGNITVDLQDKQKYIIIDVVDTGKGMPRSMFKTVFKPGYTTKKRGWGLGLTLAKRIVEEYHKGKIFVKQSEPDKGATFRIILPR